ncbi:MAG: hypothetical protein JXA25_06280 [Anaerolineales bacterium]|nr:hypothetical protein [Anaerolineales bacterium]
MSIRFDHKGKYFTEVKRKDPIRVRIQTIDGRITGTIHVLPENRLLDEINHGEPFIPITDAIIQQADLQINTSFLTVNRQQIIWMIPLEDEEGEMP